MNIYTLNKRNAFREMIPHNGNMHLKTSHYIFALALFAKQFYLLPSGNFQIGDALFVLSFLFSFMKARNKFLLRKTGYSIWIYVGCVAVINLIYSIVEGVNFNKSTLYYLYSLIIIITFVNLNSEQYSRRFLTLLSKTSKLSICVQLIVYFSGIGKWYAINRYEGTFNDPNQYGVFILFSLFLIFLIDTSQQKKTILWIVLCTFLIFTSASTGTLLGLATFLTLDILYNLSKKRFLSYFVPVGVLLMLFFVIVGIKNGQISINLHSTNYTYLNRIIYKFNSIMMSNENGLIMADRGWDRIVEFPKYIFFGAGEGGFDRFGTTLEIHSSVFGPLFYYGLLPFCFFISWFIGKIKHLNKIYFCVIAGLIIESVFLVNTRQPLFWILFLLAETIKEPKKRIRWKRTINENGIENEI